jgi:hypothetical protein
MLLDGHDKNEIGGKVLTQVTKVFCGLRGSYMVRTKDVVSYSVTFMRLGLLEAYWETIM